MSTECHWTQNSIMSSNSETITVLEWQHSTCINQEQLFHQGDSSSSAQLEAPLLTSSTSMLQLL